MLKKEYGTFSVADLKKAKPIPESEWNTFSVPPLTKEKARSLQRECNKKKLIRELIEENGELPK